MPNLSKLRRAASALLVFLCLVGAASADAPAYERLARNQQGEAVERVQQRLIELGYLHDRADGRFGIKTARAVNAFQRSAGLRPDSVAGTDTQTALFDQGAPEVRVFMSPHGKRYHARKNCRGLKLAGSIDEFGFAEASAERTPCIICYGRFALRLAVEANESTE